MSNLTSRRSLRVAISKRLGTALACASLTSLSVDAQEASIAEGPIDSVTVTGSRIARDGYDAPTPVSVLGAEEIQTSGTANVADFVNTLPSVLGSSTASNSSGSLSNGLAGIAALNLRSLGTNRTLVLLDGQRSVASASTGAVDINTFPQALIERVEIVTGGASAAYGSDAVGGVVNFILDRGFTGVKTDYQYGVTTYDDNPNHTFTLAAGGPFAGGRGHVLFSSEYFTQDGVHTIDRDWNDRGVFQINNPNYTPTNGEPFRLVGPNMAPSQHTPGGLIVSGPLRGTYFGTIDAATGRATVGQLAYGVTSASNPWMIGGDWEYTSLGHASSNSLAPDEERRTIFGRASFELTPTVTLFAQVSHNEYQGLSYYQQTPNVGNVTIRADNAFLPDSVRQQIAQYNAANDPDIASFVMGTTNAGIPAAGSDNEREVNRYLLGADGDFALLGRDWHWDTYFQRGVAKLDERLINTWNNARMALAQDAVVHPTTGEIVCRSSIADPGNGCVPINRIGIGGVTQAALDYIIPGNPYREQELTQDVAAFNFATNDVVSTWAGPVSLAFGAEWRKEKIDGFVETQYQAGWLYGNYLVTQGDYHVTEGYVETVVPLWEGLDFNGALRLTDYSISGNVETWKAGLTYQPIQDLKFRVTSSKDIRAPNLNELFAAGTARTNTVNVPPSNQAVQFVQKQTGSLALQPEEAESLGIGMVVTPSFVPGLAFSIDYFDIEIQDAIGTVTAQNTVDLCFEQGVQAFCDNISYVTSGDVQQISEILLVPFNFASQRTKGLDIEASYRLPLGHGDLSLRALATHYLENSIDNGIDFPVDYAGVNQGGNATPDWSYRLSATYVLDVLSLSLIGRGVSGGVYNNSFIECVSDCPTSTVEHRTINDNDIGGAFYVDASATYSFAMGPAEAEAFLSIRNLFNTDPERVGNGPDGNNIPAYPQTNRILYDTMGRVFRLGVRMSF
ncbi:TonB-dependent receptor [Steroidobacter sp. S1-65]|uniref:TonB-dependent receptor n=1 Tax=Steroidobacter gossypii TaxID=2805490 RepID=A0ABS1WWU3_9GAMM|nr:TonB-dependent receptor [Steroidobacter gossypii]MBM0105450.1 TonB-dependent receptor [Steroidobacter gossypii]